MKITWYDENGTVVVTGTSPDGMNIMSDDLFEFMPTGGRIEIEAI